ncbi:MAG: RNA polymerase sigma factor [Phycisphaeraceae bacterium]|nr:RNA polymerase sigma factor [Phycisphaeraceae bacterium]
MNTDPSRVLVELLVLRAQAGDRSALDTLVSIHQSAFRRCADALAARGHAADALQESWLAIVRSLPRLDDPARFRAWAYRILTNKCADTIRTRSGTPHGRRSVLAPADKGAADQHSHLDHEDADAVRRAVSGLPSHLRQIVSLFYAGGLDVSEISRALAIPAGTVKSRLHTAREELRTILEPTGSRPDPHE